MSGLHTSYEDQDQWLKEAVPGPCAFCGGSGLQKVKWVTSHGEKSGPSYTKRQWWWYECVICGGQGGPDITAEGALHNWNRRPSRAWLPLPEWTHSYLLPGPQKFGHILVHENGKVTLLDYVEQEVSAGGDGVQASVEVDLGRFRVCVLREAEAKTEVEHVATKNLPSD